jgi:rRNA maturation protein Nop10
MFVNETPVSSLTVVHAAPRVFSPKEKAQAYRATKNSW